MRVLFAVSMQPSHFYPMVPLAWALRADGHDVRVAHPPAMTAAVLASGLTSVPVGGNPVITDEMRSRLPGQGGASGTGDQSHNIRENLRFFRGVAELMAQDLAAVARSWAPEMIVFDWQCYAAAAVGAQLGIPTVRFLFGPDFAAGAEGWRAAELQVFGDLLDRLGAGPEAIDGTACVDVCPPLIQFGGGRPHVVPARYVPYNGAGGVEEWMTVPRTRPRVAITLGGTYSWVTGDMSPLVAVAAAMAGSGVELVAAVPAHSRHLGPPPSDGLVVVEDMPLALILQSCDAILHHGGDGTMATSLVAGVPQIVSPSRFVGFASYHSAARIVSSGAGAALQVDAADPADVRKLIESVLGDETRAAAAQRLRAAELERPSPVDAARELMSRVGVS